MQVVIDTRAFGSKADKRDPIGRLGQNIDQVILVGPGLCCCVWSYEEDSRDEREQKPGLMDDPVSSASLAQVSRAALRRQRRHKF